MFHFNQKILRSSDHDTLAIKPVSDPDRICSWCRESFHVNIIHDGEYFAAGYWIINYTDNHQYHVSCFLKHQHGRIFRRDALGLCQLFPSCTSELQGIHQIDNEFFF